MSTNFRARLVKLEQVSDGKCLDLMSDDEIREEINSLLECPRKSIFRHAAHPDGLNDPAFSIEEITLEMIVLSDQIDEGWRFVAQTLIDAGFLRQNHP